MSSFLIASAGLKILIVCYERQLSADWHRIARCIRELGSRLYGGLALWNFLDFLVSFLRSCIASSTATVSVTNASQSHLPK